jgi:hypothetical protein
VVVTVTNSPILGCLEIVKSVDLSEVVGPIANIPDVNFIITVTGPSYPTGHNLTFNLVDGVISGAQDLSDLIPGDYYVTETPPAGWAKDSVVTSPATVLAGDECGDVVVTVTNSPILGCLEIVKSVDLSEVVGPIANIPDVNFIITVTGPSYPTGHNLTFNLVDGVISGAQDLSDLIPGDYYVTETPPAGWAKDSVVTSPATVSAGDECGDVVVTVTNSPILGCLEVTKVVDLDDYMFASSANSTFIITVTGPSYPTGHNLTFVLINGVVQYGLDAGGDSACLCDLIPGSYTAAEIAPAGWGAVNITGSPATVEAGDECDDGAPVITVTNTLLIPHTTISITADVYETTSGGNVWLYISDTNDGQVPLTSPSVTLLVGANPPIELVKGDAYWSVGPTTWAQSPGTPNGDTNNNGIMDVGETWYWAVQVTLYGDTNITVNGHGTDPLGNPVDGPTYIDETDTITVQVGGATRTWGFWKTHLYLVQWMYDHGIWTSIDMGTWQNYTGVNQTHIINSVCKYMGLMYSDQSKNSDRTMRKDIDNARIHAAHQALAAIMNSLMPGGAPLPAGITLQSIATILSSNNITAIRNLGSALANYNESGETVALDPSLPPTGKASGNIAEPKLAEQIGTPCKAYWNTPKKK